LKHDGWRCVAYIDRGHVELVSRWGNTYKRFLGLEAAVAEALPRHPDAAPRHRAVSGRSSRPPPPAARAPLSRRRLHQPRKHHLPKIQIDTEFFERHRRLKMGRAGKRNGWPILLTCAISLWPSIASASGTASPPLPSPTLPPRGALIQIGSVEANAGDLVEVPVILVAVSDTPVAALVLTMSQAGFQFVALDGKPDCTVNPQINKADTSFYFRPRGCAAEQCTGVGALVLARDNILPIPASSTLFTCKAQVPTQTMLGPLPITCSDFVASQPSGGNLTTFCNPGEIQVVSLTFSTPTSTSTATATRTPTATSTATPSATPTVTGTPNPCVGDCNGDGRVEINEIVLGVSIGLGGLSLDSCRALDLNGNNAVDIFELIDAVNNALFGCAPS
jgi:hypothetical protein